MWGHAGHGRDAACRVYVEPGFFLPGIARAAGHLDDSGQSNPDQRAGGRPAFYRPAPPLRVTRQRQRPIEYCFVVARVIGQPGGCLVGKGVVADEVLTPHFRGIEAQVQGNQVHGPFHAERGFRPSRAAICSRGRLVGNHTEDFNPGARSLVRSYNAVAGAIWRPGSGVAEISASIPDYLQLNPQDGPVALDRRFHVYRMTSAVETQHVFLAVGHPFYGLTQRDREISNCQVFGEDSPLFSEPAAHIGRDHPHTAFGPVQKPGNLPFHPAG